MNSHRAIVTLTASIAVVGANSLALSPIAGSVADSFSGSQAEQVMIASSCYGLATALGALLLAPKADQWGLGSTLVRALSLLGVALLFSALSPSLLALYAAQALAGLAAGVALPCTYALASDLAPTGQKSHTLGRVLTGWTWGMVAGIGIAALLADIWHWRGVFALMSLNCFGIVWILKQQALDRSAASHAPQKTPLKASPLRALGVSGMPKALSVCACYMAAFYGSYAYLGSYLETQFSLSPFWVGLAPMLYGLGFGLSAPLDKLIDQHGAQRVAPVAFGALTLVYLLIGMNTTWLAGLYVLCFFWGVANHVSLNLIVGTLTALDPVQRASILGLYSGTAYLAMSFGTAAFLPVFSHSSLMGCALVSAACLVPALLFSWQQRARPKAAV